MEGGAKNETVPASEIESTNSENAYIDLLLKIQENPASDNIWSKTVELARKEETSGKGGESFYKNIPLEELITTGERLRLAKSKDEQYKILVERSSTGKRWYDIVLGHVNDKGFAPISQRLEYLVRERGRKWEKGLDVGTGTGSTISAISSCFERVAGVDNLESVLHRLKAENGFPANAEVVVGKAEKLPFDNNVFDIAVSNGLTYYLSRENLNHYINELARVLKPGGLYFESFVMKDENDLLPEIEKEYLTSAKALLVCLMDNLVSRPDQTQTNWNLQEMINVFRDCGFDYQVSEPNKEGVWFIEFHKSD